MKTYSHIITLTSFLLFSCGGGGIDESNGDANATEDQNSSIISSDQNGSNLSVNPPLVPNQDASANDHALTIKNNLVCWWPFDIDAKDASGNNHHAEAKHDFSFVKGKVGMAIRVVGKEGDSHLGGHVLLPFLDWLESGAFTFSVWVKEEEILSTHGQAYLFYGTICNITHTLLPVFKSHAFNFGDDHDYEKTLDWKKWNLFTVTYDKRIKIGFLNGIEVISEETPTPSTTSWWRERRNVKSGELLYINSDGLTSLGAIVKKNYQLAALGRSWWEDNVAGTSTRLTGAFDDVRIYDRALTAEEVQALYDLGQ